MLLALLHSYQRSTATYVGVGGLSSGGDALHALVNPEIAVGGVVTGGAADVAHHFVKAYVAAGGIASSGTAPHLVVNPETAAGGIVAGGAAVVAHHFVRTYAGAGGLVTGGVAIVEHQGVPIYVGSGGLTTGGTALVEVPTSAVTGGRRRPYAGRYWIAPPPVPRVYEYAGSGGLVTGGDAAVEFDPVPIRVYLFTAHANAMRQGGAAPIDTYSRYRHVMRVDRDDLDLLAA